MSPPPAGDSGMQTGGRPSAGFQWSSVRRLWPFTRHSRGLFVVSTLLLLVIAALTGAKAYVVQPAVDTFLEGGADSNDLFRLCALVAGIFLVQAVLNFNYALLAKQAGARLIRTVRGELFAQLMRQSMGYFVTRTSGDLTARVVNDVVMFEQAAIVAVQRLIRDVFQALTLFVVMFLFGWKLAVVCVVLAGVMGLVLSRMNRRLRLRSRDNQERLSAVAHQLVELVAGMEVVLSFGLNRRWQQRFDGVNQEFFSSSIDLERTRARTILAVHTIVGLGVVAILAVSGSMLMTGEITVGRFGAILVAMYLLQAPLATIGDSITMVVRGLAAGDRALDLLDHVPEVVDAPDARELPRDGEFTLEFDGVSFRYGDEIVLDDVSFRIDQRELVAVVGDSGAGKSTVARLMLRFYDPTAGELRLCGVPLTQLRRSELYRAVAYVSQDVFLFDGSIRDNLAVGDPKADDRRMQEVLTTVCLDEFVATLPEGLDARVGERGQRLSGGQRQRVAIARALLGGPRALILDEATSALDADLERRLLTNLLAAEAGRTIVAISHRLRIAEVAHRVLAFKAGRLVESGPASELARKDGEYARLRRAVETELG